MIAVLVLLVGLINATVLASRCEKVKKFFKKAHICYFSRPITSRYVSFETRKIIFECRCGKRCEKKVYSNYYTGSGFPIYTGSLSYKEFQEVLRGEESETTLQMLAMDERVNDQLSYS